MVHEVRRRNRWTYVGNRDRPDGQAGLGRGSRQLRRHGGSGDRRVGRGTRLPSAISSPSSSTTARSTYAAGRIPGGFFKREGRPTEKEILSSRLIDRSIRPLFDKDFRVRGPGPGRRALVGPGERRRRAGPDGRLGALCPFRTSPSAVPSRPFASDGSTASSSSTRRASSSSRARWTSSSQGPRTASSWSRAARWRSVRPNCSTHFASRSRSSRS